MSIILCNVKNCQNYDPSLENTLFHCKKLDLDTVYACATWKEVNKDFKRKKIEALKKLLKNNIFNN